MHMMFFMLECSIYKSFCFTIWVSNACTTNRTRKTALDCEFTIYEPAHRFKSYTVFECRAPIQTSTAYNTVMWLSDCITFFAGLPAYKVGSIKKIMWTALKLMEVVTVLLCEPCYALLLINKLDLKNILLCPPRRR